MKLLGAHSALSLLGVVFYLITLTCAVPDLKIQRDFFPNDARGRVQSYSSIVKFSGKNSDGYFPPQYMEDGQLVNLVMAAHDQMVEKANGDETPPAMVAITAGNRIYFASSFKFPKSFDIGNVAPNIKQWLDKCKEYEHGLGHRREGKCAEINAAELWWADGSAQNSVAGERIVAWVAHEDGSANNARPCGTDQGANWGCQRLVRVFKLNEVSRVEPDPTGEDDWKFKTDNTRMCRR